jgi:hypothetical protein
MDERPGKRIRLEREDTPAPEGSPAIDSSKEYAEVGPVVGAETSTQTLQPACSREDDSSQDDDDLTLMDRSLARSLPRPIRHPVVETDPQWDNPDTNINWPNCPPSIPMIWRRWWHRPVLGEAQSNLRYRYALLRGKGSKTPLPYETLERYIERIFVGPKKAVWNSETLEPCLETWEQFHAEYPPWRPIIESLMLEPSDGEEWSHEDVALFWSLHRRGTRWTDMHRSFPSRDQREVRLKYLRLVCDEWAGRDEEERYFASQEEAQEYHLESRDKRPKWSEEELGMAWTLDSYGLSYEAIAEEIVSHSAVDCELEVEWRQSARPAAARNV